MVNLVQVNIARTRFPLDHIAMCEFVENLDRINTLAEKSEGFLWRLKDKNEDPISTMQVYDDPQLILNMSMWKNINDGTGSMTISQVVMLKKCPIPEKIKAKLKLGQNDQKAL